MATTEDRRRRALARKSLISTEKGLRRATREAERFGISVPAPPKDPLFLRILDGLNRPQQALFQVVESIQKGEPAKQGIDEVWGALRGDLERIRFADILREAGLHDGRALTVAGFAGDIVLDPLNILPVGVTTKVSKSARRALLATPEGRRAMTYVAEALRDAPVVGRVRREIHRMFDTAADLRRPTEQVQGYIRSVEKRLDELAEMDEPLVAIRRRETVHITGRRAPGAPIEEIPTTTGVALPIPSGGKASVREASQLNDELAIIRSMSEAHEKGRLPFEILADAITASRKSSLMAKQGMLTKWVPAIGAFHRKFVAPLSKGDQELVVMVAEEAGIANRALRHQKLRPLLERADEPLKVMRAGANQRRIHNALEDLEEKAGIKVARLGGSLQRRREEIYRATEKALQKNTFTQWRETAQAIRTTAFGSVVAQKQAFALADMLDKVAAGDVGRDAVLHLMEEMHALRGSLKEFRTARLAPLSKAARQHSKRGTEISGREAFTTLTEGIVDTRIAKGKTKLLARREAQLKRLAELMERVPGYVLHYLDEDAVEWLALNAGKNKGVAAALGSAGHRSLLERKWVDDHGVPLSLENVQKIVAAKSEELADLGRDMLRRRRTWKDIFTGKPGKLDDYFGLDATTSIAIRAQKTAQVLGGHQFREDVGRLFGRYRGSDAQTIAGFRGTFAPEIKTIVSQLDEAYFGDAAAKSFLRWYDGAQMIWKGFTLFPFPAYHARNAIGDLWLMSIGGFFTRDTAGKSGILEPFWRAIPDHESYIDLIRAYRIQTHLTTGNVDALKAIKMVLPSGETWDGEQLFKMVRRKGGVGIGFHADNIRAAVESEVKLSNAVFEGGKFNARAALESFATIGDLRTYIMPSQIPRNAMIRTGRAAAQAISDAHRFAFVMKRLRSGDTLDEAVRAANKWLLDYTDLTVFETQVARRAMPFYTWLRKNLPRQVETLFDNPRRLARIDHLARFARDPNSPVQPFLSALGGEGTGLREDELPEPLDIPEWMRKSVPFPLRRRPDGDLEMITIAAWHPAAELQRVAPDTVGKTFVDMLSPLLKLPLETALERNFFFDQELGGTSEFLGREMPAKLANALQNVRLLAEFDRINMFSGSESFSTRRLRPETEETIGQKVIRLFTGAKIYPLDTRLAKARNLQPVLRRLRTQISKERAAQRREREKEKK